MSGPDDLLAGVRHLRQLGQGWSSRLLQRVLLNLLTDSTTHREVTAARAEYARRRDAFVTLLAAHGIEVEGCDGLNVWVPVHDEAAALMRLASHGIGVAPGAPFNVLSLESGHIRVTVGLLREHLQEIAAEIAAAARTGGWGGRAR